jgi:ParB-like chromosome segregation protein Spo0J
MRIRDLKVSSMAVSALTPYDRNPRTHSKKQLRQIAESIRTFGWTNPIVIDGNGVVLAGHGRLAAAKSLGIERVPIICIGDMTEAQKRAYILADNKLAENAGWDHELLTLELQGLLEMDLDFDVTVTGFEMGDIDVLIGELDEEDDDLDQVPNIDLSVPPVTQPGDLWQLGRHRLLSRTPASLLHSKSSWVASGRRWCSPIRRTMCPSSDMFRVLGPQDIANSLWPRAR